MDKVKKFFCGFKYATNGILETIKNELNIKVHFFIMFLVIILGFLLIISVFEWIICIILFSIVIAAEIFNTAIEHIVNNLVSDKNEYARMAKDASAGAVLVLAIGSAIIGTIIFLPKILQII